MASPSLPPGPPVGALTQGIAFHRDPLGVLRRCQARFGDVFTLRLPTARQMVVVADPSAVGVIAGADPVVATAGAGRRRMLGIVSPRSVLGADQELHRIARQAVAPAFTPRALEPHASELAELARRHVARWPRGRPFRLLPRLKTLATTCSCACLQRADPPRSDAEIIDEIVPLLMAGQEPAAVGLTLPIPLVHRDPRVFDDPESFRPERFLDAEHPDAFVPFGGGARRCLGQALAQLEIATLLPAILGRVRLRPLSRRPERQIVRATVLPPQRSALVIAHDR